MASLSKSKVCFYYQTPVSLRKREILKKFIEKIFRSENRRLTALNYIFCPDSEILRINKEFLKHDYYTDIITFEFSGKGAPIEGEIYISIERVKENAKTIGDTLTKELHRVIFHGALHLCGYKDKTQKEIKRIRKREDFYLDNYFKVPRDTVSG